MRWHDWKPEDKGWLVGFFTGLTMGGIAMVAYVIINHFVR